MKISSTLNRSNFLISNKFLAVLLLIVPSLVWAGGGSEKEGDETFDPTELINHHISDSHVWEIYHGMVVHLPVIVYSEEKGLDIFSSANFYDHEEVIPYNGYIMDHDHITLAKTIFGFFLL